MIKVIGSLLALALLGAGVYFFVLAEPAAVEEVPLEATSGTDDLADESDQLSATETNSGIGSLTSILALGRNLECTFSDASEEGMRTEGIAYIAGERIRSDFVTTDGGVQYDMSVIRDTETAYIWGEAPEGTMAVKTSIAETEGVFPVDESTSQPDPFEEQVEFECSRWSVDEGQFTPPADVEFVDLQEQMEAMMGDALGGGGLDCSMCDQVPAGAAKDQCLQSLGC